MFLFFTHLIHTLSIIHCKTRICARRQRLCVYTTLQKQIVYGQGLIHMLFMSKRDNQTWEIGYHKTYQNAVRLIVLIYIGYISSMYNAKGTIVVLS